MSKKNTYRPDIDGLRALAVLAVILFHLSPSYLPNGFLGVDIFFVISGFLITTILYREMEQNNFSFADFYNRRIRRILPICFVVIIVGLLLTRWIFLSKEFYGIANSGIASAFFLSNFYFARIEGGYFGITTEERPFNHIWSLSVEEQFYFIFPLLLWSLFRNKFLRKHIITVLLSLMLFLLCLSFFSLEKIGIRLDTYYLPHLRMIELLIGSLLAVILYLKGNHLSERASNVLGIFSFVLVITCLYMKDVFIPPFFPGIAALLLCIPTALLIVANEKGHLKILFSFPLIVWIGKLSYSLYLWHWVVLAVCRYFLGIGELPIKITIVALLIILLLSITSYYLIEQPFRKKRYTFKKSFIYLYLLPLFIVITIACNMFFIKVPELQKTPSHFAPIACKECTFSKDTLQTLGAEQNSLSKKILFVGDSHTSHLSPFIDIVGKKEEWNADILSAGGCPSLLNTQGWKPSPECQKALDYLQKHYSQYDIIFLVSSYTSDRENIPAYTQKLISTIHTLLKAGKEVYVLNSSANFDYDVQRNQKLKEQLGLEYFSSFRGVKYKKNYQRWEKLVTSLKAEFPSLPIIDLSHYIPNNGCIDKKPIMYDTNHLNTYGAKQIATLFIANGEKLLAP